MAGISQVWLTEKELLVVRNALEPLTFDPGPISAKVEAARDSALEKVKAALEPVACKV